MRPATAEEKASWDDLVLANPDGGEILQTQTWGDFKGRHGWKPHYVIFDLGDRKLAVMFSVRRTFLGEIWYCPKGPGVANVEQLESVTKQLMAAKVRPFVVMIEPELVENSDSRSRLTEIGLKKSRADAHISRATITVKLNQIEEELLANFKSKTRYNIRLSQKSGVEAGPVEATPSNLELMLELMSETGSRGGFGLRPRAYLLDYWQSQVAAGQAQLFFATHENEVLAAAFVTYLGKKAWYKDGASSSNKRNLMATYLLQWEIMRWLQAKEIWHYDLVGIPLKGGEDPEHPLFGLYQFKSGFSDTEARFIGTWDLPLSGWAYAAWRLFGQKLAMAYASKVKGELYF